MSIEYKIYRVSGKSMEADSMYQGNYLVVDEKTKIKNHDIVVFSFKGKELFVKHFVKKGKHLGFYPFNINDPVPKSPRIMDDVKILGKVIGIICNHKRRHNVVR